MQRVLVLGGGFAGLTIVNELDSLAAAQKAEVTLVDRHDRYLMGLALEGILAGTRKPSDGERSYAALRPRHVRFVHDEVVSVDTREKAVHTRSHTLPYDHLVLAMGAEYEPERIPGLAEASYHLCDRAAVLQLKAAVERLDKGAVVVLVSSVPFKCPPAPYEYAFLIDSILRRRAVREKVRVMLTTPEPQPVPAAGKAVGDAITAMLRERWIDYGPGRRPKAIDPRTRTITYEDGTTETYDVLAAMWPHRAPQLLREAGLADASGFVPANLGTFETAVPNVYAVGDAAALQLPSGTPHPKAGVLAEAQGFAVAQVIASRLHVGPAVEYRGQGICFIDDGQGRAAAMEIELMAPGGPRASIKPPTKADLDAKATFERERLEKWFRD
ncbi:MAG TPA: FAD-dependent oxidoreductase [Thermoplasmata archaeon]|nr:FAD-dependent oxidoreductase [Thermoplasmata archaeon]